MEVKIEFTFDGSEEKILKKYLPETSGYLEVDKIENN
jgi:polar amino acid transport system substrate-binding protein